MAVQMQSKTFIPRAQRYVARPEDPISVEIALGDEANLIARLADISQSGIACLVERPERLPEAGTRAARVRLLSQSGVQAWTAAVVHRVERVWVASVPTETHVLALQFDHPQPNLVNSLLSSLAPSPYVTDGHAASPYHTTD